MRDRLIELILNADTEDSYACKLCTDDDSCELCYAERLTDHLLANGVIVPPCKVGDKIYRIIGDDFAPWFVEKIVIYQDRYGGIVDDCGHWNNFDDFGKTVFLTKEEAEQALKEREKSDR